MLVKDDHVGAVGLGLVGKLLGLAAADQQRGRRRAEIDEGGANDADAEVLDQFLQFTEELLCLASRHGVGVYADEERALELGGFVGEEIGHEEVGQWLDAGVRSTKGKV